MSAGSWSVPALCRLGNGREIDRVASSQAGSPGLKAKSEEDNLSPRLLPRVIKAREVR